MIDLEMEHYIVMQTIGRHAMPKGLDKMYLYELVVGDMPDKAVLKILRQLEKNGLIILKVKKSIANSNRIILTKEGRRWLRKERLGYI